MNITISRLSKEEAKQKGIDKWDIWEKEVSCFDWFYDSEEACYILEGELIIKTDTETVSIKAGDYVVFPQGLSCVWDIKSDIKKHVAA